MLFRSYYEDTEPSGSKIKELVRDKEYDKLPEGMRKAAREAVESLLHTGDGQHYQWYQDLTKDGVHFVTRLKRGAAVQPGAKRRGCKSAGILEDREIRFRGVEGVFRTVRFLDEARGEEYEFVTNALDIAATTVAALYKERWQVELFFKWMTTDRKSVV